MLIIRGEQLEVIRKKARVPFETEMVSHAQAFSPRLTAVIGEAQLRVAITRALDRAEDYGFTSRGPLQLYVELMFLFGSAFDSDPQYPWSAAVLRSDDDEMRRAEGLFQGTVDYQRKVSGPAGVNTRRALEELSIIARQSEVTSSEGFVPRMRLEMSRIFPEKALEVGERGLTALIEEASAQARRYDLPLPGGDALLAALMFAFGHGCADDPLYPWIVRTLRDDRISEPSARTMRLQRKAVTWLDHVLAGTRPEAET
jgi:hypothetical protein